MQSISPSGTSEDSWFVVSFQPRVKANRWFDPSKDPCRGSRALRQPRECCGCNCDTANGSTPRTWYKGPQLTSHSEPGLISGTFRAAPSSVLLKKRLNDIQFMMKFETSIMRANLQAHSCCHTYSYLRTVPLVPSQLRRQEISLQTPQISKHSSLSLNPC
jgi:hypothetical protein